MDVRLGSKNRGVRLHATGLVLLMLLSLASPLLMPTASAHEDAGGTVWPMSGSEDTGWVKLDAVSTDGIQPASADWNLTFAPGASLDNVSFQVRVSGADGMVIDSPLMIAGGSVGSALLDLSSQGWMGQTLDLDGGDPFTGRTSTSGLSSSWTLPGGATVTDLVIQALAPADPTVSLKPLAFEPAASATHPDDGRLWLAVDDRVLVVDAAMSPPTIDIVEVPDVEAIVDLEVDVAHGQLLVLGTDAMHAIDLANGGLIPLPDNQSTVGSDKPILRLAVNGTGDVIAVGDACLHHRSVDGTWSVLSGCNTNTFPMATNANVLEMQIFNGLVHVSLEDEGVLRYDPATSTSTIWTTANVLHSDVITSMVEMGNQILFGSEDAGIGRYNPSLNLWQATWSSANWLADDQINGLEVVGSELWVLAGSSIQRYDINSGVFTTHNGPSDLADAGLGGDVPVMMAWPTGGARAPSDHTLLIGDGTGTFLRMAPGATPMVLNDLVLATSPPISEMTAVAAFGDQVHVGGDDLIAVYNATQRRWTGATTIVGVPTSMVATATDVWVGTEEDGLYRIDAATGNAQQYQGSEARWDAIAGLAVDQRDVVMTHDDGGVSVWNLTDLANGNPPWESGVTEDVPADATGEVAVHNRTAYFASEDGLLRLELDGGPAWLASWGSTGIDQSFYAPIVEYQGVLHYGLYGYGVVRIDLATGEILSPLLDGNGNGASGALPSDEVFSIIVTNIRGSAELAIGTQSGAVLWDGSSTYTVPGGRNWDERPGQHLEFMDLGSYLYAATNLGVCRWQLDAGGGLDIDECLTVYDGMPNWATYSIGHNSTHIFGGTLSGVGVIDRSSFSVVDTWETQSADNAPVAIVSDIAYIGLDGIGVARWDLVNSAWLNLWTSSGVLDTNGITGLVAGTQANTLWVGGDDGFQLIDVINSTELVDIEKSSGLYYDNGDPYDLIMIGDMLHYNQRTASDRIYRIDTSDYSSATNYLDIGIHLNEGSLDVAGMGRMGDVIVASAVSSQWWNTEGSGGIVRWNATSNSWLPDILPDTSIQVMEVLQASNGDTWIQYGDDGVEVLDANGTQVLGWSASETPDLPNGQGGYPMGGGMVEWGGDILFASEDGVGAYDPSAGTWSTYWSSTSTPEVYELWTDGNVLFIGATSGQGWNPDGVVIMEDANGTQTTVLSSQAGDFSNAYPISIEACDGMVWTAFFQLSGGAQVIGVDPNGVASDVVIDGQDFGTNARPAALACSGTELHVGFWSVSAGVIVWDLATNQVVDQLTSADGMSNSPVYYDAMATVGSASAPSIAVGYDTNNGEGGYAVYDVANRAPTVREQGALVTTVDRASNGAVVYGIPGLSSGYSQVGTWWPPTGASLIGSRIQLNSGAVSALAGSGTTLYAATYDPVAGFGSSTGGSALLIGDVASNGTLTWTDGHVMPSGMRASSLAIGSQAVHVATAPRGGGNGGGQGVGLLTLDLLNGTWSTASNGLSDDLDGLAWYGNELVTGLVGGGSGVSGVQIYDPPTDAFVDGGVLGGLPSNTVLGLSRSSTSDVVHIATDGGVGRFDRSLDGWDTPITVVNGLPSNNVEDVVTWFDASGDEHVLLATDGGLSLWNASADQLTITWDDTNGLLEASTWGLFRNSTDGTVLLAHDGLGSSRPGATVLAAASSAAGGFVVDDTHRFDQLPSNDVTAVASDWWGLHIATDSGTMTHWNALNEEFEEGLDRTPTNQPVVRISSDGTTAVLMTQNGLVLVEASSAGHALLASETVIGVSDVGLDGTGAIWATTFDDGLAAWGPPPGYQPVPSAASLRATPLNLGIGTGFADVTEYLHPGTSIDLLDLVGLSSLALPNGTAGTLTPTALPLVFSSTTQGAAVWASTDLLLWNGTFEMADDAFVNRLQAAVDTGRMLNGNLTVEGQLFSPVNGSMEVRLIYDWSRTETPVELLDLSDRPDDGGSALRASWSLVHDEDFARYLLYLKPGGWAVPPTAAELQTSNLQPDAAIALHSRLQADVFTAGGEPLIDGQDYSAVVVVEYADGRLGTPSMPLGPASPSDEVPRPPNSGEAMPSTLSNAADGDLDVRWERCTSLDHASTRLYASTVERTDVVGLTPVLDLPKSEGNETTLTLQPGRVYWIGLTCVDEAGQENLSDALILGPVVPTGGLDDGLAPPPLKDVEATDAPNDEGGRILVTWTPSIAVDCAFYTVWLHELGDIQSIDQVGQTDGAYATRIAEAVAALRDGTLAFEEAEVVADCSANETVVDDIGGRALVDGRTYLVAVTAHDVWLNVDLSLGDDTIIDDAIPFRNVIDEGLAPERLLEIETFDHPEDDGRAIDVVFAPSAADDFDHYLIWTFTEEVTNVSAWYQDGVFMGEVAVLRIDTQLIDAEGSPFEITINEALHRSDDGTWSVVPVEDGMTVHAVVTVHDLRGNVHLDGLTSDDALAVDNLADQEAPDRIEELVATDRPEDDGSAVLLEFLPSTASDVAAYEVYVLSAPFNRVSESANPALVLDRTPTFPVVVDRYSDGSALQAGTTAYLAVVVRDASGNAHLTDLTTVAIEPVDDGVEDPGLYLDPILGITAAWLDEVDVLVAWEHTNDPSVRAYRVYFASESFPDVESATLAGEVTASNSFRISSTSFPELVNSTGWYIAVTPVDDTFERTSVETVFLVPLTQGANTDGGGDEGFDFATYLTGPNAIIAGLVLVTFLLALLVLRRRSGQGSKTYTLQEATWGIQEDAFGPVPTAPAAPPTAPPPAAPASALAAPQALSVDLYAAAEQLTPAPPRMEAPVSRSPSPSTNIDGLLDDLGLENRTPAKQGGLDTSFLDDLL